MPKKYSLRDGRGGSKGAEVEGRDDTEESTAVGEENNLQRYVHEDDDSDALDLAYSRSSGGESEDGDDLRYDNLDLSQSKTTKKRSRRKINFVCIAMACIVSFFTCSMKRHSTVTTKSVPKSPLPPPLSHGGLVAKRVCDLRGIKDRNETVTLAMFPKHGTHVSYGIPKDCMKKIQVNSEEKVAEFIHSESDHKILPVRGQASFYKSAFNHVCNKKTKAKNNFREHFDIDCTREGELGKLLSLNMEEISRKKSPFIMKEIIMQSREVRSVMLMDYTCLTDVVNSVCDASMQQYDELSGKQSNSALGQNYTDFWSMHNYPPLLPFDPFWDDVYANLTETCCLEFTRQ